MAIKTEVRKWQEIRDLLGREVEQVDDEEVLWTMLRWLFEYAQELRQEIERLNAAVNELVDVQIAAAMELVGAPPPEETAPPLIEPYRKDDSTVLF